MGTRRREGVRTVGAATARAKTSHSFLPSLVTFCFTEHNTCVVVFSTSTKGIQVGKLVFVKIVFFYFSSSCGFIDAQV